MMFCLSDVLHNTIKTFKPVHSTFFKPAVCPCVGQSWGANFSRILLVVNEIPFNEILNYFCNEFFLLAYICERYTFVCIFS